MPKWTQGIFTNGMAWSCYGDGDKVALLIPGGPGNPAPAVGWQGWLGLKIFGPLVDEGFRLLTVARRRNMPQGHSVEDMAADYAQMIEAEFDGQLDLVVGVSYGGLIAQYLAANHPSCFKHIVVLVAACEVHDPEGIDQQFAQAIADGRLFEGGGILAKTCFPDATFPFFSKVMMGLMVRFFSGESHEYTANDVLVEAEAEARFNAREALPRISVPVLLIGGDEDVYFPEALARETADLIPNCTLRLYEGKGHLDAGLDKRVPEDILAFIAA